MKFLVIENRINKYTKVCFDSLKSSRLDYEIIKSTDGGILFDEFKKNYVHLSTNNIEFELICFRRYFLLADHLTQNIEIKDFVLSDSDVVFFPGVEFHIKEVVKGLDVIASSVFMQSGTFKMVSPHISYWKRGVLFEFLNFLVDFYGNVENIKILKSCLNEFIEKGLRGGVTDMTLIYLFLKSRGVEEETITRVINKSAIDHNVSVGDNSLVNEYKTIFGIKRVHFINGCAYCTKRIDGSKVRFYAFHFQGKSKILMQFCYDQRENAFLITSIAVGLGKKLKNLAFRVFH